MSGLIPFNPSIVLKKIQREAITNLCEKHVYVKPVPDLNISERDTRKLQRVGITPEKTYADVIFLSDIFKTREKPEKLRQHESSIPAFGVFTQDLIFEKIKLQTEAKIAKEATKKKRRASTPRKNKRRRTSSNSFVEDDDSYDEDIYV